MIPYIIKNNEIEVLKVSLKNDLIVSTKLELQNFTSKKYMNSIVSKNFYPLHEVNNHIERFILSEIYNNFLCFFEFDIKERLFDNFDFLFENNTLYIRLNIIKHITFNSRIYNKNKSYMTKKYNAFYVTEKGIDFLVKEIENFKKNK